MNNIIREEVIEWISKPENEELLETLKLIKESSESKDWFDDLTEDEIKSLRRGQKDHLEGNTLSSEEFWKKHA